MQMTYYIAECWETEAQYKVWITEEMSLVFIWDLIEDDRPDFARHIENLILEIGAVPLMTVS